MTTELNAPWQLVFDRDGTEDFGIILDSQGNELAASHLPCTRIAERTHASGTFWLPECEGDAVPSRVREMTLMAAAPDLYRELLAAYRALQSIGIEQQIGSIPELAGIRAALELAAELPECIADLPRGGDYAFDSAA